MNRIRHTLANRQWAVAALATALSLLPLFNAHAQTAGGKPAPAPQLPAVEVISTTPLPGLNMSRELVPAPVQTANDADIQRANSINIADFLNRNLGSVHINEMQNNPFQPDVNYRGYTASPLLGTPQGLSIYMDGVRMNQPFGDVMSWDLIPKSAISSITLMPGSNPLFGLNTLGGALSIQTKDGRSHPGASITTYGGSNGRHSGEFEYGSFNRNWDWFVTGTYFKEQGWRDASPSKVGQIFGKLGWRNAVTDIKATLSHADNTLTGNGLQDFRLLANNYNSLYSKPDITENRATLFNLQGSHSANDNLMFSGNAYYRRIRTSTLNGDVNEGSLDQSVYQPSAGERAALTAAGFTGFPLAGATAANTPFPFWRCIANVLLNDEPAEKCSGIINRTTTTQNQWGMTGQFTALANLGGIKHQFTGGGAWDGSKVSFAQTAQLGYLNPDRSVTGLNSFADGGVTGGNLDGAPFDRRVNLEGRTRTWGVYATDTMSLSSAWHLTLSGRYNETRIDNTDQLNLAAGAGSLTGSHRYSRFNPAAGVSFTPRRAFSAYASYSEGSRAPSSIELGCADPLNPCRLPNSMAGDPPLNQVVTKTFELGAHGTAPFGLRWNAGVFRAENHDDILFVAAPAPNTNAGYFKNFGKTRRDGFEAGLNRKAGAFNFGANYTWLKATYQSADTLNGVGNSANSESVAGVKGHEDGTIRVLPGNRIPLIPEHMFKIHADYVATGQWTVGGNMLLTGSAFARGNENNLHAPDGRFYLGEGKTSGYTIFNLNTRFQVDKQLSFFAQVNNVFDRKYNSGAQLGPTGFTANGNFIARPFPADNAAVQQSTFFAPGAPRMGWIGIRYVFDIPKPSI